MKGFFPGSMLVSKQPLTLVPKCGACGLYQACVTPKMPVAGWGEKGVLIVAEAPGKDEDEQGSPLVGKSGQFLRRRLNEIGIDLETDCWRTNALICRPPDNRTPTNQEIEYCRPNLLNAIKELSPRVVIVMGGAAIRSLIGHLWRADVGSVSRWAGWQIPSQELNAWVCPTVHPSYVIREWDSGSGQVLDLLFKEHLQRAFSLRGRPWDEVPDYRSCITRTLTPELAARAIECVLTDTETPTAFDYETTTLKPDSPEAHIICCSMAWRMDGGPKCLSFFLTRETEYALGKFLRSPIPKIASNLKFEDRWTRQFFGHRVRNWHWDTMQAAHVIDNRPGITSLKFQAFVLLGFGAYDDHIAPYLHARDGVTTNKILTGIDPHQLLLYCGLDSLLELEVAFKQKELIDANSKGTGRESESFS